MLVEVPEQLQGVELAALKTEFGQVRGETIERLHDMAADYG